MLSLNVNMLARISVLSLFCVVHISSSAIPMWEYLSRGEKMSHLFNMFVPQVEKHCSEHQQSEPDCSKLLLVYGLTNLANMADHSLDDMDPYQRNANKIVWDSMMAGHSHSHSTTQKIQSLNEADDMVAGDEEGAASSVHETQTQPQSFLLGPMVVRVLPNGMPIPGEKNDLPKDEDVEEFSPSSKKMDEIAKHISSTTQVPHISNRLSSAPAPVGRLNNYYHPSYLTSGQLRAQQRIGQQFVGQQFGSARVRSPIYSVYP